MADAFNATVDDSSGGISATYFANYATACAAVSNLLTYGVSRRLTASHGVSRFETRQHKISECARKICVSACARRGESRESSRFSPWHGPCSMRRSCGERNA